MSSLINKLYRFSEFSLDPQTRTLQRGNATVPVTPKAFDVLLVLVQNAGQVVTKDALMKTVWPDSFVEESNLTQTVFRVRKALDETEDRRYIQTVQGQGYRFLVAVTEIDDRASELASLREPSGSPKVQEISPPWQPRRAQYWKFAAVFIVLAAILVLVTVTERWRPQPKAAEPAEKIMLAVLPFENFTGDSAQDYFSDGLTEEMISQLGNLDPSHLGVIARTSVMHYKYSQEPVQQIGKDLGVQYVVEGSVRRDSERVRITAQLIQVKDQSHLWAREYDRDLGRLLELQGEIAREVANEVEFSLTGQRPINMAPAAAPLVGANSYDAYDLYLKGRYFWNKRTAEGFQQAADYFQQAIDKDPNYGRAYAGLADTYSLMSTWSIGPQSVLMPKARAAASRALEIDERLAEAHASLALIKENYDYDWPGAEKEFRRAIQLNPQYATAHQWYAEFLSWQGRFEEAFAESEQARQLDPLSLIIASDHATILYESHQYENALKQCHSVLELDPTYRHAGQMMASSYLQLGKYGDAADALIRWAPHDDSAWNLAWQAVVYTRWGQTAPARDAFDRLKRIPTSDMHRTPALLTAYAGTGQKERMLDLLQQAYSEHSNAVVKIKVDPLYDPFRNDARFEKLLRQLKLE
jgi:TolB-like protein/DNA-binding winged helix-turn-helix (wHTH) protein/Tfp pilus assembly protein PilF